MKFSKYFLGAALAFLSVPVFADPIVLTERIEGLDATVTQTAADANGNVAVTVAEVDGKLSSVSVDASGLKTALQGTSGDDADAATIAGAKAYADSVVADMSVTAAGETGDTALVTASADGKAVTVATTQKLKDAVAAAETAVQTVAEGTANGTVKVDGTDVAVHGLGSAAYAATTDFDASGAAAAVQGATTSTVKDVEDAAAAAQATADAAVVANNAITAGTHTKITYDAKGLVTGGADLAATDIPDLDASKVTSGTFADARIASAAAWNAKQEQVVAGNGIALAQDDVTLSVDTTVIATKSSVDAIDTRVQTLENADPTADIDARIVAAIKTGITVDGVTYKLVVDPATAQ